MLQMWPRSLNFLFLVVSTIAWSLDILFRVCSILSNLFPLILRIRPELFISNAESFALSASLQLHGSEAYKSTLKTHMLKTQSFLYILSLLLFQRCLNETDTTVGSPITLFISFEQLLWHARGLSKYWTLQSFSSHSLSLGFCHPRFFFRTPWSSFRSYLEVLLVR